VYLYAVQLLHFTTTVTPTCVNLTELKNDAGISPDTSIEFDIQVNDGSGHLAPGSYDIGFGQEPDGGLYVSTNAVFGGLPFYYGATGSIVLQQSDTSFVGTFVTGLGNSGKDAGTLQGSFTAPVCPPY
jgi:hypothetical protein